MVKIAIISNYRLGSESGVASVSEDLVKYLSKNNQLLYICLGKTYEYLKGRKTSYLKLPSEAVRQGYIPKLTPKIINRFYKDLNDFSPEVIHAQNIVFAALMGLIWAKRNNIAYLITFHSLPTEGITWIYPKVAKDKTIKAVDYKLTTPYVKRFIKNSDMVIALNNEVKKSVENISRSVPMKVINNGVALDEYFKLKINKARENILFTYLGSYMSKKNQEFLLRTFNKLPNNFKLELYGNIRTGGSYVKKLNKFIKEKGLKNVTIGYFLSRSGVRNQLEKTNYFISASLKEVQSIVIIEALASGVPIIGLENETINEVIDGKNGIKLPQIISADLFAGEILKYVERTNESYDQISNYCRQSVKRFDINSVTNELNKVYKTVVRKKNRKERGTLDDQALQIIPNRFQELFYTAFPKLKKPRTVRLSFLLSLLAFFTLISWPFLIFNNFLKDRLVPALRKYYLD